MYFYFLDNVYFKIKEGNILNVKRKITIFFFLYIICLN